MQDLDGLLAFDARLIALSWLVKRNMQCFDLDVVIPVWHGLLPIWEKADQAEGVYQLVADFVEMNHPFYQDRENLCELLRGVVLEGGMPSGPRKRRLRDS